MTMGGVIKRAWGHFNILSSDRVWGIFRKVDKETTASIV